MKFYDLLFQRYANPMVLLNQMIRSRRFEEFVIQLVQMHNEELEDKTLWDIWLHRVFDKGFDEFKKSLSTNHKEAAPTQEEVKSIAMDSMNILAGFVPDEGLVQSGDIQNPGHTGDQQRPGEPGA